MAEYPRIDVFELWCWRLLRVLWTIRSSNQSILKEINPEYSLGGLMLKLEVQYFGTWCEGLIHWKRPWCWERLRAGGEGGDKGWDGWIVWLLGHEFEPIHTAHGAGHDSATKWASLVAQLVKNPPAMWETWARSLGWEDHLEKGNTTHSGILAWRTRRI